MESYNAYNNLSMTDIGNAERIVYTHRDDIRYCHTMGKWFIWDDKRWNVDSSGMINSIAVGVVKHIAIASTKLKDEKPSKDMYAHYINSSSKGHLTAMVDISKSMAGIPIQISDFDRDDWLMNVSNGTLNLTTLNIHDHRREDYCTKMSNVVFNAAAECPKWIDFVDTILSHDEDLIRYVQKIVGSALCGYTSDEVFYILYGTGGNGKTTFIEVIKALLGDYAVKADADTFMSKKTGSISNDVARLAGARFVDADESNASSKLDEGKIKTMSGRGTITARYLYREPFEFLPQYTLVLSTNYKPHISGTDKGIWRRVKLVPFTVTIPKDDINSNLRNELMCELSGILNWALEGCRMWQEEGIEDCKAVIDATDEYREDMDTLAEFFIDCCEVDSSAKIQAKALYDMYCKWADETHVQHRVGKIQFGNRMKEKGFERIRDRDVGNVYIGLTSMYDI